MNLDEVNVNETLNLVSVTELLGHTDTVTCVGFNFDGTLALTASYDGTVRIWKVPSGELVQVLEGPEDIEWAEWHVKGNAVVAGSRDGTIWMWLTFNGQCVQVFAGKMCLN
jgi:ribosome assembly protein SQT1